MLLRRRSGKSTRDLAEEIGSSNSTVQRIERGDPGVGFSVVYRALAALDRLDISIGDLGSDDPIV